MPKIGGTSFTFGEDPQTQNKMATSKNPLDLVLNPPIHIPHVTICKSLADCRFADGWLILFSCSMKDEEIQVIPFSRHPEIRIQENKGFILESCSHHSVHMVTIDEDTQRCKRQDLNLPLFVLESLHGLKEEDWASMIRVMTRDARLQYADAKDVFTNDDNEYKRYRREIHQKNNIKVSEHGRDQILYEKAREDVCLMFIQALEAMDAKISFTKQL